MRSHYCRRDQRWLRIALYDAVDNVTYLVSPHDMLLISGVSALSFGAAPHRLVG